jgi:magnesium-transporting ATPase (P-type)
MLCGDGQAIPRDGGWEPVGDPTEAALVVAARKAGMDRAEALQSLPRTGVIPFDSERRYMATVHDGAVVHVKGAVESVLAMCDRQTGPDGTHEPLDGRTALAAAADMGSRGQRVLAPRAMRRAP